MKKNTPKVGRPPKYRNEKERTAARKAQNRKCQERVGAERRERYQNDPVYRAKILSAQRARYRARNGRTKAAIGHRRGKANAYATKRSVLRGPLKISRLTLNPTQCADFLDTTPTAFAAWVATGKFPRPQLRDATGTFHYTARQMNAMCEALFHAMKGRVVFRASDTAAIAKVHAAFHQTAV